MRQEMFAAPGADTMQTSFDVEMLKAAGRPRSPHWPAVRKAWLSEHDVCMGCGGTKCLEVHHMTQFHLHPELELDPTNFVTLCEAPGHCCHFRCGHGYNWTLFNIDVLGDAAYEIARVQEIHK